MNLNKTNNTRQAVLENSVNRFRVRGWLKNAKNEAESAGMASESRLINDLIEYIEQGDTPAYRKMRKTLKLRKLRII